MEVRFLVQGQASVHGTAELPELLARSDGMVWVDIPNCDEPAADVLRTVFGFHPVAVRECVERQRVPKFHAYQDHVFLVLHAPEKGAAGHVHYVELDQFVGPRYLVTVHGPTNVAVAQEAALRDTAGVWERVRSGRLVPGSPWDLSHAVVTSLNRGMEDFLERLTEDVWHLEQRVTAGQMGDPEHFLDEMFRARHGLLAVVNMSGTSQQVCARMGHIARGVTIADRELIGDIVDEFGRVQALAERQKEYLQGVIEFYRTRTDTKMAIAAERLAVIAVVTLPITALASVFGMNVIVHERTNAPQLIVVMIAMSVMSTMLLIWARRRGWW